MHNLHAYKSSLVGILKFYFDISELTHWRLNKMTTIFTDVFFKYIFLIENVCILIGISLKFVSEGQIDSKSAFTMLMTWRLISDKPLPGSVLTPC